MGIKSALNIPLAVNGRTSRTIVINSTRSHIPWPEEYVPRLRLMGEVFVNALERCADRSRLEEHLRFETLLFEISAHFINLPADEIDGGIEDAQRRICELLRLDRSTLWQSADDGSGTMRLTHWRLPPGSPGPPERMSADDFFPWAVRQIRDRKPVVFPGWQTSRRKPAVTRRASALIAPSPRSWCRCPSAKARSSACWALRSCATRETGPRRR